MTSRARIPLVERFWAKVQKAGSDECWIWTGAKSEGYGRIMIASAVIDGKHLVELEFAHRLSYYLATGDWAGSLDVRHACHDRACVNPRHLSTGTRQQNMDDMVEAGRSLVGELQPNHKLTWDRVRSARQRYARGATATSLARECGVSQRTMRQCLARETWIEIEAGER